MVSRLRIVMEMGLLRTVSFIDYLDDCVGVTESLYVDFAV